MKKIFTADGQVVLAPGTGTVPAQGGRPGQPSTGGAALLDPLTPRWVRSFASMSYYYTAAIAVSPDGRTLYVSFDTNFIAAFEVATGKLRRTLHGHAGCVRSLAITPDGRRLLSGSDDTFALLWDTTPAGVAKPRKEPLTEADADGLWTKLAGDDAGSAFAAMADLAAAPDRAVALVRRELKPVPQRRPAGPHVRRPGQRGLHHSREGVAPAGGVRRIGRAGRAEAARPAGKIGGPQAGAGVP